MSKKCRTLNDLLESIDHEFSWRFSELKNVLLAIRSCETDKKRQSFIRAGISLCYAHWEGFVKNVGNLYLSYISLQRLPNKRLQSSFVISSIDWKMRQESHNSVISTKDITTFLNYLRKEFDRRSYVQYKNQINTKSNLSYKVFVYICKILCLNHDDFELKQKKIDELVKSRNSIAHGEYINFDESYYEDLHNFTLEILRLFKEKIFYAAENKQYEWDARI